MDALPTWLLSSLIFLGAAVLVVPLFRALGLGAVIGYLAAGVAIGPWGLRLVGDVNDTLDLAQFGVVLMLFLVGLGLDPKRLWALRHPIFGWGSAQMVLCTAALFAAGLVAGYDWRVSLVGALGLSLSSTAIALQVMGERNLLGTHAGQSCISISLFQDVVSLPMLALLPLLALAPAVADASATPAWLEAGKIIGVIMLIVLGGRLALRPVLRWIASKGTAEIFTAAALLLVVATSALMQAAGLSMALGAFLAGVLLADSEYRRALETDIEPFKGLLLGLFFMAVGMSMDFGVIAAAPGTMALLVLAFLAIKCVAVAWLAKLMDLHVQERPVFVLMLAQGSEFAFVVFQAAAGTRVLEPGTASMLIGAVAVSMAVTPLLVIPVERWLVPRLAAASASAAPPEISELQDAPVIVAGFGRYGQIVARMLSAQGLRATVLDHDPDMIEAAGSFGYTVFYGDATRLDLLRTAGAQRAQVLVVAVDDTRQSLAIVDLAREHFPHLQVVARARDVTHWNELRDRGVVHVDRELFESSLRSARTVLEVLGVHAHEARRLALRFRRHNFELFERMYPHHKDRSKLIAVVKQGRLQLEEQMAREREQAETRRRAGDVHPPGWEP
jgi:glutathione-regulated potassium-efflux system ancillary protein KefC